MQGLTLTSEELRKLLSCGCPEAVSLYLYSKAKLPPETAADNLHLPIARLMMAKECLRQLGLWRTEGRPELQPERPVYSEQDVSAALRGKDPSFPRLVGEAQRRLGRTLSGEELKVLLSLTDYLRLPVEVVGLLLSYCIERARRQGGRMPAMRTIEREAYRWFDEGIDTLEQASFYVQTQLAVHTRVQQLRLLLQIDGRRLTAAEEKLLSSWIAMGFSDEAIAMAYERTCLNTGALKWPYMNSILTSWHEKGLHTPQQIAEGDVRSTERAGQHGGYQHHDDALSPRARQAVARAIAEGREN